MAGLLPGQLLPEADGQAAAKAGGQAGRDPLGDDAGVHRVRCLQGDGQVGVRSAWSQDEVVGDRGDLNADIRVLVRVRGRRARPQKRV